LKYLLDDGVGMTLTLGLRFKIAL